MKILALIAFVLGVAQIIFGFFSLFSNRLNKWFERKFPDSELDKKLLSTGGREFLGRYLFGARTIFYGGVLILIAFLLFMYK